MTPARGACNCPACIAVRLRAGRRSSGTVADLVHALGANNGKPWFALITGRQAHDKLDVEVGRWFAEPGSAAKLLARLSGGCLLLVGMLVEAPAGLTWAEIELEMQELGCGAGASPALAELSATGLLFQTSPGGGGGGQKTTIRAESWLMLPGALREWLAPAVLPLLLASGDVPGLEGPAGGAAGGSNGASPVGDPVRAALIWLGAMRATGGRITGGRLYKKDRERIEALAGLTDADETMRQLLADRLIRVGGDRRSDQIRANWVAIEAWVNRPATVRLADDLGRRHGGDLMWQTLIDAAGDWVEEAHLARRSRLVTSTVYARPAPNRDRRRDAWARQRAAMRAWPEIEERTHAGRTFFRLLPSLSAPLRGGPTAGPTGHIFVQPDFEVLVPPDAGLRAALLLTRAGRLAHADVVLTFKLTPDSVRHAAVEGLPAPRLLAELEKLAAHGVPPAVSRAVQDWSANVGRCAVERAVLARFDDESVAARAAQALGDQAERVGPAVLIVREGPLADARELLEKAGFPPRGEDGDDRDEFALDDPFGEEVDGEPEVADGEGGHDEVSAARGSASLSSHHVRAAAVLGLPPTLRRTTPEPTTLKTVQAARRGAPDVQRAAAAPQPRPRQPAATPEAIAKRLCEAAAIDAEVILGLTDDSELVGRILLPFPGTPGNTLRVLGRGSGTERRLPLEAIQWAGVIHGTARNVSRNQTCPCGSGRKFKRCCGANADLVA